MKRSTFALTGLLTLFLTAFAGAAAEPQAWIVQFPSPAGVMDLHILVAEGKAVAGFATETDCGPHWDADVTGLTATDAGGLAGEVKLTPRSDITAAAGKNASAAAPATLTLCVQAKDGRLRGTIAMGKAQPVEAFGRVGDAPASADAQIEVLPLGISSGGEVAKTLPVASGLGSENGDCVLVRCAVVAGKVADSAVVLCPEPLHPPKAIVARAIPAGTTLVFGHRLAGGMDVAAEGLAGRLTLDGQIIGNQAVGNATWQAEGGQTVTTTFRAWVSRMKFRQVSDASDRTWPVGQQMPADPALAAQAAKEALTPLRPGEPGKLPFYSTRTIHLGNYRALYAPAIAFGEVPGAVRYRITAKTGKAVAGWSFEAAKPWVPLTPIWEQVPVGPITVSAVGLDAAGKEVGAAELPETVYHYVGGNPLDEPHWKLRSKVVKTEGRKYAALRAVPLVKIAPFAGPYWAIRRSPKEAALAAARCGRDDPGHMKVCRGLAGLGNYNYGDGGFGHRIAAFVVNCCTVARWTDDPVERVEAIALAERLGWRLHLGHRGGLPTVYKGNIPSMDIFMQVYQDLHELTGDERFREAALDLARVLAKAQQPNGGFIHASGGARQAWPGGVFGPAEFRENGAEVALRLFGELRKRWGTNEFADAEQKARAWTLANALPSMMWQNVGHHSLEMILIQDTVPAFATDYAIWLLDLAEDEQRDVAQAIEVVRWSEERVVDWARQDDPGHVTPFCQGWTRAAGSGTLNAGRLAYCFARLYQETKDPLWKAKAEALVQGILEAQDPVTGFISPVGARNVLGGARIASRDMGIAAAALVAVPKLLAEPKVSDKKAR